MCTTLDLTGTTVLCITNVEISIPDAVSADAETAVPEEAPIISGITVTDSTGATHILGQVDDSTKSIGSVSFGSERGCLASVQADDLNGVIDSLLLYSLDPV